MPKRSASDALAAVVPAPKQVDSGIRSRSGRTVKPRVWDDGTLAAPLAALKDDALGERSPGGEGRPFVDRADAADPDFTPQEGEGGEEARGHGGHAHAHGPGHRHHQGGSGGSEEDEEAAYSSESPRVSVDGSQGGGSTGRARSGSVGRDEHGKFTAGPRPRGARGGRGRGEGGGGIFKQAAVEVLRLEKRLMSTGEIARVALKRGLIKCTGKTPEATMASALYTDIKRKEGQSVFIRPHEGLFGLREWVEQGVAFQDEFAEEMAKRAAAAFGAYVGMPGMPMLPPMMDADGVPIATPFPMMPFHGMPPMPGMPMLPHMLPSMPHPLAVPPGLGAGAKAGGADGGDGLMELLEAAEELHKSAEKGDAPEGAEERRQPAAEAPAALAGTAEAQQGGGEGPAPMDAEQQPAGTPAGSGAGTAAGQPDGAAEQQQQQQQPGSGGAAAAAAAETADEEGDAAAALAAVAAEAAAGGAHVSPPSAGQAGGSAERQRGGYPAGAMPYPMQYPATYGYPPYFYPHPAFMYPPHAAGLPPLPKAGAARQDGAEHAAAAAAAAGHAAPELPPAGSAAGLDLTVRGTNRPFAAARGGSLAAAVEAAGQEQVNILNLPLPEAADVAQAPAGGRSGVMAPPARGAPDPEQLKEAEASVMRLEKELGTSHPEVGKAYLSLSRLYLAGCEDSASKQLATAALSRSWEILNVCQLALKKQPSCTSSFSYLMDKIRAAEAAPLAAALAPPPAGAAPPASAGVPPAAMPAAAAALSLASPPPAAAGQRQSGGGVTAH